MYACSGILFNHESPLRPERFVTRKIVSTAVRIANGSEGKLKLGNIDIWRDWGYAPDYVEAMWLMLQQDMAQDYVIATGKTHSLRDFIQNVFSKLDMDWQEYTEYDRSLCRPSDLKYSCGDPAKAREELRWEYSTKFDKMIEILINEEASELEGVTKT